MPEATRQNLDSRLRCGIDLGVFSLPVLVTVALYLPSGLLMPVRLVTLLLAAVAVRELICRRGLGARRTLIGVASVSAIAVAFGALAMIRYREQTSVNEAVQFGFIVLTCLTLTVLIRHRRSVLALISGWFAAAGLAAVVGLWEVLTARHLPGNSPARQYANLPGWNEISSFFDNPNLYAYHCAVVLLLLPLAWYYLPKPWRWGILPFGLLVLYLLERTNGRMALATLVIGGLIWCLRYRWSRWMALVGIAVTAITMALSLPPGHTLYRFGYVAIDGLQWEGKSTWVRVQMAKSGWWMAEQSSFLGVGPGGFATRALDPQDPYRYQQLNNAHWGMVEVLAEYGIGTLVALLVAIVVASWFAFRAVRTLDQTKSSLNPMIAFAGGILMITIPVISISHSTWLRQPLTAVHLGTVVALLSWTELCRRRAAAERAVP